MIQTLWHTIRRGTRLAIAVAGAGATVTALTVPAAVAGPPPAPANEPASTAVPQLPAHGCRLGPRGQVDHVVYLSFDNVHLTRDNPNVPSDLQQMPHLLNFLTSNGTLITHHHTPLISHTGTDLLSAATGLYGDRHGQPISNNYRYFHPDGTSSQANTFTYWTDRVYDGTPSPSDTAYSLVTTGGKNTPAPWVPFTRAGCDFGAIASSNAIVENADSDVPKIFGPSSPEAQQVRSDPDPYKDAEMADYGGLAVHCTRHSRLCTDPHAVADLLPDEPGGYHGYRMLVGNRYLGPHLTADHSVRVRDIFGHVITNPYAKTPEGAPKPGFPGFDGMTAATALGYTAALQESGVPVTYTYLSDVHDPHAVSNPRGGSFGPGEAGMETQLRQYDAAFARFFTRLKHDGITTGNTLFVVTADEGDHFIGVQKSGCDGVTTPCTYTGNGDLGEVNTNLQGLLAAQRGDTTPFDLYAGVAPAVYVRGNPEQSDPSVRRLERDTLKVTATNPYTGRSQTVNRYLADRTEQRLLHLVTADPARTPTFVAFGRPDFYECQTGSGCPGAPFVQVNSRYAWNHGTVSPQIVVTWLGLAGPGVQRQGYDRSTWSDQTDIRPTMLALLGLTDDYVSDGRVLLEDLTARGTPRFAHSREVLRLGQTYKQLNACVGAFGLNTLRAATEAAASGAPGQDRRYHAVSARLEELGRQRDVVAAQIQRQLTLAEFGSHPPSQRRMRALDARAHGILAAADRLAG
ncbi:MAG TPA: hypothetical protein VFL99_03295 [Segeticoccus sp.]|uniref:hypothetical protein n=1 Tax=Segeticoccus sp. TaxID=2706531 RepID=UPI002D7F444C|nr:hypothetical protein [Segeticoccus sp.]HET8599326.1 hypothetical protein [Segeticoccus sp.]